MRVYLFLLILSYRLTERALFCFISKSRERQERRKNTKQKQSKGQYRKLACRSGTVLKRACGNGTTERTVTLLCENGETMTDKEAIDAMEEAQEEGLYLATCVSFEPRRIEAIILDTQELADKLLESLFSLPTNQQRFRQTYDYIAVWQGHTFYAARLSSGHEFSRKNFFRYLEEMDV